MSSRFGPDLGAAAFMALTAEGGEGLCRHLGARKGSAMTKLVCHSRVSYAASLLLVLGAVGCGHPYRVLYGSRYATRDIEGWKVASWLENFQRAGVTDSLLEFKFRYEIVDRDNSAEVGRRLRIDSVLVYDEGSGAVTQNLIWSNTQIHMEPTQYGFEGDWVVGQFDNLPNRLRWQVYLSLWGEAGDPAEPVQLEFNESLHKHSRAWLD